MKPAGLLLVGVQLALLVLVVLRFEIEHEAFRQLFLFTAAGFFVHALLPLQWRLRFFAAGSLAALFWVMRGDAWWILAAGSLLIGICHLPRKGIERAALLLLVGGVLAAFRADLLPSSVESRVDVPASIWPVLGSMFMFRIMVYLYDRCTSAEPFGLSHAAGYFFMVPNVCFPLFPVVDYKTWTRSHYQVPALQIYQKGTEWIFRGLIHLIVYRVVYLHFSIPGEQVSGAGELARHMVAIYLLYLKVSGQFHVIVGMLCLFGFNLPETHHLYYLSSSFNDFWRRINIYWKDFMMKLFYYPIAFRFRRLGTQKALVLSTMAVFFLTWLFHSYQWFWILGEFPLRWQDVGFWGGLGVLVVVNSLWEAARGRTRSLGKRQLSLRQQLLRGGKIGVMFALLAVLWSFWNSESLEAWFGLFDFSAAASPSDSPAKTLPAAIGIFVVLGSLTLLPTGSKREHAAEHWALFQRGLQHAGAIVFILLLTLPSLLENETDSTWRSTLASIQTPRLSAADQARRERGYYEDLTGVDRFGSPLWELYSQMPGDWIDNPAKRLRQDFLEYDLLPDVTAEFKGAPYRTNRFGMRDQDYDKERPPKTFRAAVLGSSYVMGSGVGNGESFEALLEKRLNAEANAASRLQNYELLNFAVGGYSPLQQLQVLTMKARQFSPDAILYVAHANDFRRAVEHLAGCLEQGMEIPYPFLETMVQEIEPPEDIEWSESEILMQQNQRILEWTYRSLVEEARELGATPIWVYLPRLGEHERNPSLEQRLFRLAEQAGFEILDLSSVYDGVNQEDIIVAEFDSHPNQAGHQRIAEALYRALADHPELSRLADFSK